MECIDTKISRRYLVSIDFGKDRSHVAYCIKEFGWKDTQISTHLVSSVDADLLVPNASDTFLIIKDLNSEVLVIGLSAFIDTLKEQPKNVWFVDDFLENIVELDHQTVTLKPFHPETRPSSMLFFDVVQHYLRLAGDVAFGKICDQARTMHIPEPAKDDIEWMITVPTNWTNRAIISMREAAYKSGLNSNGPYSKKLGVCVEPEGAALYCALNAFDELLKDAEEKQKRLQLENTGLINESFIVINIGGKTTDITYHKITEFSNENRSIDFEEIRPPSGGPWGDCIMNNEFEEKFMKLILGESYANYEEMSAAKVHFYASEFRKMINYFDGNIVNSIQLELTDLATALNAANINLIGLCKEYNMDAERVKVDKRGHLVTLQPKLIKEIFDAALQPIKEHIQITLNELPKTPNCAFVVGGMGSNKYVKQELSKFLQTAIHHPVKLIEFPDPGLAIVKGALLVAFEPQRRYLVSIDLGTDRSGVAFYIKEKSSKKSIDISFKYASTIDERNLLANEKSGTFLSIKDIDKEEMEIGLEAFLQNIEDEPENAWFANDFKMMMDLQERRRNNENIVKLKEIMVPLKPFNPKTPAREMSLFDVVRHYLRLAGDVAFNAICAQSRNNSVPEPEKNDIEWVITVPAIWTDQARIFMREAAFMAGLNTDGPFSEKIGICLEPEGAAIYCAFKAFDELLNAAREKQNRTKTNTRGLLNESFMVIDIGGGTTDITYHKITKFSSQNRTIEFEEIRPPSGGPWGGRFLNREFDEKLMKPLLGVHYTKYAEMSDVKESFHAIEFRAKNSFDGNTDIQINLDGLAIALKNDANIDLSSICKQSNIDSKKAEYKEKRGKSMVTLFPAIIKEMFASVLQPLKEHLKKTITEIPDKPSFAFLVGGMGSNKYVRQELENFLQTIHPMKLIQPPDAGLAIVKGAVHFAFDQSLLGMRKARTNYGLELGVEYRFYKLISKGESLLELAKRTKEEPIGPFGPIHKYQKDIIFSIYETDEEVEFVTDPRCIPVAEFYISDVDMSIPFLDRQYIMQLSMDGPVITGIVTNCSTKSEHLLQWSSS